MNTKAEDLEKAIREAVLSDDRVVRADSATYTSHSPISKDCGSIEEWKTISCEVSVYVKVQDEPEEYGSRTAIILNAEISYDESNKKFTVNIDNLIIQ